MAHMMVDDGRMSPGGLSRSTQGMITQDEAIVMVVMILTILTTVPVAVLPITSASVYRDCNVRRSKPTEIPTAKR